MLGFGHKSSGTIDWAISRKFGVFAGLSISKTVPESLEAWSQLAQTQNLAIQQARLQRQYAEDARRVEQAARYPQVEAVGSYGYAKQSPESIMSPDGQFDQVGIEMNWNVFSGGGQ